MDTKLEIKPCPCGEIPEKLCIELTTTGGSKWAYVCGYCCGEWNIEFRLDYKDPNSEEAQSRALQAWNNAQRAVK